MKWITIIGLFSFTCSVGQKDARATIEKSVIGVSVELTKSADPFAFVKTKGFTYTIALNGNQIAEKYQVLTYPTVYIINKHGQIIHAEHTGGRENFKQDIIRRIGEALNEK